MRRIAQDQDPAEAVTNRARRLVTAALDAGWSGPPFDPLQLADILKIELRPRHDVRDAQLVPVGKGRLRIEFNPNRARARIRFSIAHEIAHTLFEDHSEEVRRRLQRTELRGDDWQLESLCNLAAAEILMPVGSFTELHDEKPSLERMLDLQQIYQVSTEALLIRSARVGEGNWAIFTASRLEEGSLPPRFRLEYLVGASAWRLPSSRLTPPAEILGQCTAVGFTAKGWDTWGSEEGAFRTEAVGLPPYPGSRFPRLAGIVHGEEAPGSSPAMTFLIGDATEPRSRPAVVVQVVNDATPNWGGRGFARAVRKVWPPVQESFRVWAGEENLQLGKVHLQRVEPGLWVASMVAQHGYGPSKRPRIRYAALRAGLATVAEMALAREATIHLPRIGCGEGGGEWTLIEDLIRLECVRKGIDVTVYDLPGVQAARPEQQSLALPVN